MNCHKCGGVLESADIIVCLVGASGTGKTTAAYLLAEQYGYNVVESYTTRPPRYEGEKGHKFVDRLHQRYIDAGIIAYTQYNGYEYWATRDEYKDKGVSLYIVDVAGVLMLRDTVKDAKMIVVALYADRQVRKERLWLREMLTEYKDYEDWLDKYVSVGKRIKERMYFDETAFSSIPCHYVVDANKEIESVVEEIQGIIVSEKPTN